VIGRLSGTIEHRETDGSVIVEVNGVGYEVFLPLGAAGRVGTQAEPKVTLHIHTHVREDALQLYGFATALEQALFERLIGVGGIGPKVALSILSGIEPAELTRAIRSSDVARLTRIPGVGKKTAERVVLELKDRLPESVVAVPEPAGGSGPDADVRADLLSALANLGYQRGAVDKTVDKAIAAADDRSFEPLLRATLQLLMGR